jgi:hypothetical protein
MLFAGAVALSFTQPAISIAAPAPPAPPPMPPSHASLPAYHPAPVSVRPLEINVRPQMPPLKLLPYRYPWQQWGSGWTPGFLLPQLPCVAKSPDASDMPDVTLGSLVDAQSRNFLTSYPAYDRLSGDASAAAATTGPALQYGFQPFGCAPSFGF